MPRATTPLAAGLLIALLSLLCVQLAPASATETGVIEISEGQTIEQSFPALPPGATPNTGDQNDLATPDVCQQFPSCGLVRLKVVLPADYNSSNDFAIQVRLEWETSQLPNDQGEANDLDLYLWDEPAGDAPIARSIGSRVPEIVGMSQATKGSYNIVVRNQQGLNSGYKLTVRWISGRFEKPVESQDPTFGGFTADEDQAPPAESSFDSSSGSSEMAAAIRDNPAPPQFFEPAPDLPAVTPSFALDPVVPDADFDRIGGGAGVGGLIDAQEQKASIASILKADKVRKAGKPPSGIVLAFWLAVVPILLLIAIGTALFRRRPLALSVASGSPS
jgi:hypothetical protein